MSEYPGFKPIELSDRAVLQEYFSRYPSEASDLNFTNLFIWRAQGGLNWAIYQDWLILQSQDAEGLYFYPPIGPAPRLPVLRRMLRWLHELGEPDPRVECVEPQMLGELLGTLDLYVTPVREKFDYVYCSTDLIHLAGRKYHRKRNHLKRFVDSYPNFVYAPLTPRYLEACREVAYRWYQARPESDDPNLLGEMHAVQCALDHFEALGLMGGVILLEGRVEAFTIGERVSETMTVIHAEKADPEIQGLYTMINQQFCAHQCTDVLYINREQDLGDPGLRQAKESYYPHHLVEKFRISGLIEEPCSCSGAAGPWFLEVCCP